MKITGLTALKPAAGGRVAVSAEESTKLDSLKSILAALEERGLFADVNSMDLSAVTEIRMVYQDHYSVRLPMYSDDFHRLIHTMEVVAENPKVAGRPGTIDLTLSDPSFYPDDTSF